MNETLRRVPVFLLIIAFEYAIVIDGTYIYHCHLGQTFVLTYPERGFFYFAGHRALNSDCDG